MMWLLYAAFAAVCFGMRGILYHWMSQKPADRSLLLLGVYVSGAIISILGAFVFHHKWNAAVWMGLVMGVFSFISNAAMFRGFAVGKASLVAIFTALTPIVVVGLSYGFWGETLNLPQSAAFIVILSGIIMIRYSNDISFSNLKGAQWALLAMVTFGITDVASKQAMLWEADKLPTLFAMYATGSVLFFIEWLRNTHKVRRVAKRYIAESAAASEGNAVRPSEEIAEQASVPLQWKNGKTLLVGMGVGISNISGMVLILPAFELGITGLVSAVVATNVLLILLYARFFLKEVWSMLEFIGIITAIAGILILRLLG
jgi:drug/metabolite transporter (DMT)-like permease